MSFPALIRREMQGSLPRLLIMSGLAGASNAGILAAINAGASAAADSKPVLASGALFIICLVLFIKTQQYVLVATTIEVEAIIHRVRLRLMDHVRRSELLPLDSIGRAQIVGAITRETQTLTQAAIMFAFSAQGIILVFFVAIYILILSPLALLISFVVIGVSAGMFLATSKRLNAQRQEALEWENKLYDRLNDLIDGFKEVRLNSARSQALFEDIVEVSRTAANIKIRTQSETFKRMVWSQSSIYLLLGAVVFIVPAISSSASSNLQKTTTALLFVISACWGLVQSVPILLSANSAADNIERLEQLLRGTRVSPEIGPAEPAQGFSKIEMRGVQFHYRDKTSDRAFEIGPINFELRAGELVFIMGGNGSGKSTFMKVLAGLYVPDSGEVLLDGVPIDDSNREYYRSLITAVFSDYHLFLRLYGIPDPDMQEVERLLTEYRLDDKTSLSEGEFKTIELSGGQRKRLALIVSLLEKRPLLLLDEWAAEQDPEYRHKFYHELLPALHRSGVTIVVVSHDDRYIDEAHLDARILRMEEGRFVEQHSMENV
jgi:putative ATP-binding cassette transporter